jgi:hypothetical protein
MEFIELEEFNKDLKRLLKKYRSLPEDLEVVKRVLGVFPVGRGDVSQIPGLKINRKVFKMRIMCRSVKGKTFRLIYSCSEDLTKIILIELYFKGDKENEDRERIMRNFSYLKNQNDR